MKMRNATQKDLRASGRPVCPSRKAFSFRRPGEKPTPESTSGTRAMNSRQDWTPIRFSAGHTVRRIYRTALQGLGKAEGCSAKVRHRKTPAISTWQTWLLCQKLAKGRGRRKKQELYLALSLTSGRRAFEMPCKQGLRRPFHACGRPRAARALAGAAFG